MNIEPYHHGKTEMENVPAFCVKGLLSAFLLCLTALLMQGCTEKPTPNNDIANVYVKPDDHLGPLPKNGLTEGSFTLKEKVWGETREVKILYLIPIDANGKAKSSDLVFYAPYFNDTKLLANKMPRRFAEEFGIGVYTFVVPYSVNDIGKRDRYYCFSGSGWHKPVFDAQAKLQADFGLEPRKLFVVGESSGGSMAELLCAENPDKMDAAAMLGGRFFDPLKGQSATAWLSLNTWDAYTEVEEGAFRKDAEAQGIQVLHALTPPNWNAKDGGYFHHAPGDEAINLMQLFIRDVAKLRSENGGVMPSPDKWPATLKQDGKTSHSPSEAFTAAWNLLPAATLKELADKTRRPDEPVYLEPSGNAKPRGLAFFVQDPKFYRVVLPMDNLYYLSGRGLAGASVEVGKDSASSLENVRKALGSVLKNGRFKVMPVYVLGIGAGGNIAALAALESGDPRIKRISTFNSDLGSASLEGQMTEARGKSSLPLRMYFDHPVGNMPIAEMPNSSREQVDSKTVLFGKYWFKALDAATSETEPSLVNPPPQKTTDKK